MSEWSLFAAHCAGGHTPWHAVFCPVQVSHLVFVVRDFGGHK